MSTRQMNDAGSSERIFLLNRVNERFLAGESRLTAQERRTLEWLLGVLCLALLVGFLITSEHVFQAKAARHLKDSGRSTLAVVVKKEATSSGQGRDFCYITYQFRAQQVPSPAAPEVIFSNRVEVPDHFFDRISEGQSVPVVYDPLDPSVSMLEALIRIPRSPTWLVWTWWIGCSVAVGFLFRSYVLRARLSSKGRVIRGNILALTMHGQPEDSPVEIRFAFDSPTGRRIESKMRAEAKHTNFLAITPPFTTDDAIAVLYMSDSAFLLL